MNFRVTGWRKKGERRRGGTKQRNKAKPREVIAQA